MSRRTRTPGTLRAGWRGRGGGAAATIRCGRLRGTDERRPCRASKSPPERFSLIVSEPSCSGATPSSRRTAWGRARGLQVDWAKFADQWRAGQGREMGRVRRGELPWTNLDGLHRMILDRLLTEFNITGLSEAEKVEWNQVWHRLQPWPDTVPGLTRLKTKYTRRAAVQRQLRDADQHGENAGLPWDAILTAELAKQYRPRPRHISPPWSCSA